MDHICFRETVDGAVWTLLRILFTIPLLRQPEDVHGR